MNIFVNFPVENVERSKTFYSAIGWSLNETLSDDNVACFLIDDDKYVMALSRSFYESVGGDEAAVGGAGTPSPVTVAFALPGRDDVDALIARAESAGARIGTTDDYDFMYQRQFDDPDGYHFSPFWMRPDAVPAA